MDPSYPHSQSEVCDQCGKEIPAGSNVCPYCGNMIRQPPQYGGYQPYQAKKRTNYPMIAGVLLIVAGILAIATGVMYLATTSEIIADVEDQLADQGIEDTEFLEDFLTICGALMMVFGLIAIGGGALSIKRRMWGFALVGSIFAILSIGPIIALSSILGIIALILLVMAKDEFE
jgi:hypothetical protein